MKKILQVSSVVFSFLFSIGCATSSGVDYGDCNEDKLNYYGERKVFKEDKSGTAQIHIVLITCKKGSHTLYKYGATTEDGKLLVPPEYTSAGQINPISDKRAVIVKANKEGYNRPYIYTFETKKFEETGGYNTHATGDKDNVVVVMSSINETPPTSDALLYSPYFEKPRRVKGIGGKNYAQLFQYSAQSYQPIHRYGDVIVANYNTPEGFKASQILNLIGEPLTPLTNPVELITFYVVNTNVKERTYHKQLASLINEKVSNDFSIFKLYLPLDRAGQFIKLPKNVIGLSPTPHYGWFVFIETSTGVEAAYYKTADLSSLDDSILKEPRFKSFGLHKVRGYQWDYLLSQRTDGKWFFFDLATAAPRVWTKTDQIYATKEAAEKDFYAYIDEEYKKSVALKEAEAKKQTQLKIAQRDNLIAQLRKVSGTVQLCNYSYQVTEAGQPFVDEFLTKCKIYSSETLTRLRAAGASANLLRPLEVEWGRKFLEEQHSARSFERNNSIFLEAMKTPVSLGPIANPGQPSQQQQNYQMNRDVNRQIFKRDWDPYK